MKLRHVIKGFLIFRVRNLTRSTELGHSIAVANTSSARNKGLLKQSGLLDGHGLWLVPCEGIHTFFMKFAIDLVYIDRKKQVRKVVRGVTPWRLSVCISAHSVIELPAGSAEKSLTQTGDQLEFEAA